MNTEARTEQENPMLPETVTPIDPAGPETDEVPVFCLRGIDSFLRAAKELVSVVSDAHEEAPWLLLHYRLLLAGHYIGRAGAALWPHDEQMDTYIADAQSLGHPAYIKFSSSKRFEASASLGQAMADLDVAIKIVRDNTDHNPYHDRDYRMLIDARDFAYAARATIPDHAYDPDESTVPF